PGPGGVAAPAVRPRPALGRPRRRGRTGRPGRPARRDRRPPTGGVAVAARPIGFSTGQGRRGDRGGRRRLGGRRPAGDGGGPHRRGGGDRAFLTWYYMGRARVRFVDGRWDDALAEIQAGLDAFDPLGMAQGLLSQSALIAMHRGDFSTYAALATQPDTAFAS